MLIHISGTIVGKFNRKHTGKSDWEEAKAIVAIRPLLQFGKKLMLGAVRILCRPRLQLLRTRPYLGGSLLRTR